MLYKVHVTAFSLRGRFFPDMVYNEHGVQLTDERLKEVVTTALLHWATDDVQQVTVTVTVAGTQMTFTAEDATGPPSLSRTRL